MRRAIDDGEQVPASPCPVLEGLGRVEISPRGRRAFSDDVNIVNERSILSVHTLPDFSFLSEMRSKVAQRIKRSYPALGPAERVGGDGGVDGGEEADDCCRPGGHGLLQASQVRFHSKFTFDFLARDVSLHVRLCLASACLNRGHLGCLAECLRHTDPNPPRPPPPCARRYASNGASSGASATDFSENLSIYRSEHGTGV